MTRHRHLTLMTLDDHRAAEREWATVHRSVAEFENIIRAGRGVPDRLHRNVKRIRNQLAGIQTGMYKVLDVTLPDIARDETYWAPIPTRQPIPGMERPPGVLNLAGHIRAARALAPSQPAVHRLLDIIGRRRSLPVRILDCGIRILNLIQMVRLQMEGVQYNTLREADRWVNCWIGECNCFYGDDERGATAPTTSSNITLQNTREAQ